MHHRSARMVTAQMALSTREFTTRYPTLYHMAEWTSWGSIQRLGLLSTRALLDLFEIAGEERRHIESEHRPESVEISHHKYGSAVIRDQKPMSERALAKCLRGISPKEWYELLNERVFFWSTEKRVKTLLGARAYRDRDHLVLTIDALQLVARYSNQITLSPINSGSTVYNPQPRGRDLFQPFRRFPWEARRKYGKQAIAEIAIPYSVPDVMDFVIRGERRRGLNILATVYKRR